MRCCDRAAACERANERASERRRRVAADGEQKARRGAQLASPKTPNEPTYHTYTPSQQPHHHRERENARERDPLRGRGKKRQRGSKKLPPQLFPPSPPLRASPRTGQSSRAFGAPGPQPWRAPRIGRGPRATERGQVDGSELRERGGPLSSLLLRETPPNPLHLVPLVVRRARSRPEADHVGAGRAVGSG